MGYIDRDLWDNRPRQPDGTLLASATGRQWLAARRPELYGLLTRPTGLERDTRNMKFEE
jgi:hypothetical protein